MKTISLELYSFSELSDKAKEKVRERYINDPFLMEFQIDEASQTLKAFFELFPASYRNIDFLEPYRNDIRVNDNLEGKQLTRFINSIFYEIYKPKTYYKGKAKRRSKINFVCDCPFTGVCYDMDILTPVLNFIAGKVAYMCLSDLLEDCVEELCKSVKEEYNYRCSFEAIEENTDTNEIYFDINGNMYNY